MSDSALAGDTDGMDVITKAEATRLMQEEVARLPVSARGCPFCGLVESGALRVAENSEAVVMLDAYPRRRGHLLVILRRHVEDAAALPWSSWMAMQRLAWEALQVLEPALSPRRVYVAALGSPSALPTSFPHLHIHLIPLHHGDERDRPANVFTFEGGVLRYRPGDGEALAAHLKRLWPVTDISCSRP
jgi:diadenosine tetraphosphate (Ap4A) HIT family hydrolase